MRKEKENSLLSIVLVIFILIIVGFLGYQFWVADILGLRGEENPLDAMGDITNTNQNRFIVSQVENTTEVSSTNVIQMDNNAGVGGSPTKPNMR